MKIAIVGSGISGLAAARALDDGHEVTIFERDERLGGHACTVDIDHYGPRIPVDVGFIIYNRFTYPNFYRLLHELRVRGKPTQMSFSVSLDDGRFEWGTGKLEMMLAQPSNVLNPTYYRLLFDILRFFRVANADLAAGTVGEVSLREYLARHKFGLPIVKRFLVPMGASIWSASATEFLEHPAEVLLGFMKNHQLLSVKQPVWLTIPGGSRAYVDKLRQGLRAKVHLKSTISQVAKTHTGTLVSDTHGNEATFDHVVLACHAPDALRLLKSPSHDERDILSVLKYSKNLTVLHGDTSFMPKRRRAWGSWNYVGRSTDDHSSSPVSITYWMNQLQHIDEKYPLFVTLNPVAPIKPDLMFASFDFDHPQFDRAATNAQKRLATIQGKGNVWFCGAYAGHGFHEDGIRSGLEIAHQLGATSPELLGHARIFRPVAA
jgi:predicted NAD/FAD-binding protein